MLYSRVELSAWLSIERNKAKCIEKTEVRMCESTLLIWHIDCVKRRRYSVFTICVALVFYIFGKLRQKEDSLPTEQFVSGFLVFILHQV